MLAAPLRRCAIVLMLLAPASAAAAPPVKAADAAANQDVAREKARAGLALYGADRWQEAYDAFREAEQLHHAPPIVLYMARCQRKLGKLDEARALYQRILGETVAKDAPAPFVQAREDAERELEAMRSTPAPPPAPAPVAPPPPPPPSSPRGSLLPGGVVLGVGVVGLGVGAVTGAMSLAKVSDIKSRCHPQCSPADKPEADSATLLGNVSTAAFVVGGVAAATGIVLLVLRPGGAPKPTSGETAVAKQSMTWSAGIGLGRIELGATF